MMQQMKLFINIIINIGIAADTDKGLLVPVVKDADRKSSLKFLTKSMNLLEKAT